MADDEAVDGSGGEERSTHRPWSLATWIAQLRSELKARDRKVADPDPDKSTDAPDQA